MRSLIGALLALFILSGCASNQPTVQVLDPHVQFQDTSMQSWMMVDSVRYMYQSDGFLKFQVMLSNTSAVMRQFAYMVEFYDQNGFVINTIMSKWKFARVNGNGNFVIEGISPNDKTADFRVILRSTQYGNFYGIDAQNQENKTQFD